MKDKIFKMFKTEDDFIAFSKKWFEYENLFYRDENTGVILVNYKNYQNYIFDSIENPYMKKENLLNELKNIDLYIENCIDGFIDKDKKHLMNSLIDKILDKLLNKISNVEKYFRDNFNEENSSFLFMLLEKNKEKKNREILNSMLRGVYGF